MLMAVGLVAAGCTAGPVESSTTTSAPQQQTTMTVQATDPADAVSTTTSTLFGSRVVTGRISATATCGHEDADRGRHAKSQARWLPRISTRRRGWEGGVGGGAVSHHSWFRH